MARNPFEHHHDHGPDHDHDSGGGPEGESLDPAQQSLADALRVSFTVLKLVMLLLVVVYLLSGFFSVKETEVAVRLRFGRIVGDNAEEQILKSGRLHWALPYPIEKVITIPKSVQQIEIDEAFWYKVAPTDVGKTEDEMTGKTGPLNPEQDGSLLTGDANIVHARWSLSYEISNPVDYLRNIGDPDPKAAEQVVRAAAEEGIIRTVAGMSADDLLAQRLPDDRVALIQQGLDAVGSGIQVTGVTIKRAAISPAVAEAYRAVINAASEKAAKIEQAEQFRTKTLGETAGEGYAPLWALIQSYEQTSETPAGQERDAKLASLEAQLDEALTKLDINKTPIGGKVSEVINDARTYRSRVVEQVSAEARQFELLLPQYQATPRIVMARLWQDTKAAVLSGDVETFYLPAGQTYLELNRDPKVKKDRDVARLRAEQDAQRRAAMSAPTPPSPPSGPPGP